MISAKLLEDGMNTGLFDDNSSAGYWSRRLLQEDESDSELMRSAGGKQDSEAMQDRKRLLANYEKSLGEQNFEDADRYHAMLKAHHKEHGGAVGAEQARAANIARESRFGFHEGSFRTQAGRTSRPRSSSAHQTAAASGSRGWTSRLLGESAPEASPESKHWTKRLLG
jgi:hypothetical protein